MVRISDILKRERDKDRDEEKKKEDAKLSSGAASSDIPPVQEVKIKQIIEKFIPQKGREGADENAEQQKKQEVKISPAVINETKKAVNEECLKIYEELLASLQGVYKDEIDYNLIDVKKINSQIEKLVIQLSLDNENILALALAQDSSQINYLFCHSVNTCIYGVQIGIGTGLNRSELIDLGVSALFHDIGMTKYINTISQPRPLTDEERKEIQNHTLIGFEILQKIKDLPDTAARTAAEHHERVDGSGYPNGLKSESINQYAKIIGLADVFTAMVHDRPYRKKKLPVDAVKEILNVKNTFEYNLIKLLLNRIGIYPIGSIIQLNTNETAQVVKLNYEEPLRPVVNILPQEGGQVLKETKVLDLSAQPAVFIKSARVI